jgi:hypothetical protein
MKKIVILFLFLFSTLNISEAVEGEYRMGVEFGFSSEAVKTPLKPGQEIADTIGSSGTITNDSRGFVGRIFSDYGITSDVSIELGYFQTLSADAKYTFSGSSSTVTYDTSGFDISGVVKDKSGFYGKAGLHSATMKGPSEITIGSTTYTGVTSEADGTGALLGVGYEKDNIRYSFTHYNDLADTTDLNIFSVGYMF